MGKVADGSGAEWLEQLYEPRSVAVVGASDDIKLAGGRLLQFLITLMNPGRRPG
jgi:acyl-CoA synthetase (NDP forming)